ncbi:hypothetical protein EFR01_55920 [Sinorhizobium fredii]|nr:hypothetical protein EFR01_55920 [Sinorhizobium fredii]GLS08824.1 hypothetical protein GCM10007864_24540 [Sinorhizobium fredii]
MEIYKSPWFRAPATNVNRSAPKPPPRGRFDSGPSELKVRTCSPFLIEGGPVQISTASIVESTGGSYGLYQTAADV